MKILAVYQSDVTDEHKNKCSREDQKLSLLQLIVPCSEQQQMLQEK